MNNLWQAYLYFGGFILSAVVSTGFVLYAWRHRQVPSATSFAWLLTFGSISLWGGLGTTLFPPETGIPYKVLYFNMIGVVLVSPAWLCFALDYSGRAEWLTRWRVLAIYALPLITLGMLYTNPLHHY